MAKTDEQPKRGLVFRGIINTPTTALTLGGVVLMYVSGAAMILLIFYSYFRESPLPAASDIANNVAFIRFYFLTYSVHLILLVSALLTAAIGYGLLRAAGTATKDVIPTKDYDLIKQMLISNNQDGINDYIKLNSLTGIIGAFTKLGLPGLPLATIALTLFFALFAMIMQGNKELSGSLFDLAKLTLGAFIGSYVQRSSSEVQHLVVAAQRLASDGQKASGDGQGQQQSQDGSSQAGQSDTQQGDQSDEDLDLAALSETVPLVDRAG